MPHSPLNRWLGILIVVLFGIGFLWQDDAVREWTPMAVPALFLLLMIFAWSTARGTPPLHDEAFHRTLPPGDHAAWLRVLSLQILLLGMIGMLAISYCVYRNFSWKTQLSGALLVIVPLWALMSGTGIAGSFSTARGSWKVLGPVLMFGSPILGMLSLTWLWVPYESHGDHTPVTAITAALVYPAIWWLVAVRRRLFGGAIFGVWTGTLVPWLQFHGDFVPMPKPVPVAAPAEAKALPAGSPWRLSRKPIKDEAAEWLKMEDHIGVDGLARGEFLQLSGGPRSFSEVNEEGEVVVRNTRFPSHDWTYIAKDASGRTLWGEEAVWSLLRAKMPTHQSFGSLAPRETGAKVAIPNPGYHYHQALLEEDPARPRQRIDPKYDFALLPWRYYLRAGVDWREGGSFELGKGGSYRLPEGGMVEVLPFTYPDAAPVVTVRRYHERPAAPEQLWFGAPLPDYDEDESPRFLLHDAAAKKVIALGTPSHMASPILFGLGDEWSMTVQLPRSPTREEEMERLKTMRLHVFFPMKGGTDYVVELPPP